VLYIVWVELSSFSSSASWSKCLSKKLGIGYLFFSTTFDIFDISS
jgi:hypothetical protein